MAAPVVNEFEHLQAVYRRSINKIVRDEFKDINDAEDANLGKGSGVSKASLKHACIHKDNDTAAMTQMRTDLFYFVLRKAQDLQPRIYGIPVDSFHEQVHFKPQIQLFFSEDWKDKPDTRSLARSEITFRLMDESIKTLTDAEIRKYARKIKEIFATPPVSFKRGKTKVNYFDRPNGYQTYVLTNNKAEGKRIFEKVLQIQGHELNEYLLSNSNREKEPTVTKTKPATPKKIIGRDVKEFNYRPVATVHFRHATLKLHGLTDDIVLVDLTGKYWDALEPI